jgi:hypothetical protein
MIYQIGLKNEMKVYLAKNDSSNFGTRFTFSVSHEKISDTRFNWEEENEEFRYDHDLYDVISLKKSGDSIRIYALKDSNENNFEKQWNEVHHKNRDASSAIATSFVKLFCAFHYMSGKPLCPSQDLQPDYLILPNKVYCITQADVNTPPPKFNLA